MVAALAVTTFDAQAAPLARASTATGHELAAAGDQDFGSRRRGRARRGNAAGLAMMGMMVGTIGAVIAAQQRREAYEAAYNRRVYGGYGYYPQPYVYDHPRVHRHGFRTYPGYPPGVIGRPRIGW